MKAVNQKLVEIALEQVHGSDFEQFFHAFYPALSGIGFVPLGGVSDGGADAFQDHGLYQGKAHRPSTFYQASIEADHRSKIRSTVKRLREVGRKLTTLQYFTSRIVRLIDMEEENLSVELDVDLNIRDRKWIVSNINHSPQTLSAFETYLRPSVTFVDEIGGNTLISNYPDSSVRTMCVFLGQEVDRRRNNSDLLNAVTDSLILWALEDTDPETGQFLTRREISEKIKKALPSAKHIIHKVFNERIAALASKQNTTGREVRWYKNSDEFCLPYNTRQIIADENIEDEFLKLEVMNVYKQRASEVLCSSDSVSADEIANIVHRALELTFEKNGLELVEFLTGDHNENQKLTISDQVDDALAPTNLSNEVRVRAKEVSLIVLGQAFYSSTKSERVYYGKLSRTYTLLLTLRNEPKIVEYFRSMSSDCILFVGSDIIIRALSERYLPEEDQMTVNMLRILREAGSKLVLTQTAAEEVQGHLAATDYEFRNNFLEIEPYLNRDIVRHANKILIRAYFYAKFDKTLDVRPETWMSFIGQICSYQDLHNDAKSRIEVRYYLVEQFAFEFLDIKDLAKLAQWHEVEELTERMKQIKSSEILARNDARQILAVYGKRRELKEWQRPNPYGYRTWWLTHETKVSQYTKELVREQGAQYIMRPEFILNFIALSPTTAEVRKSYDSIFPTIFAIRISNRMRDDVFHDVLEKAKEIRDVSPARAKVIMANLSNQLKGDNFKIYEATFARRSVE